MTGVRIWHVHTLMGQRLYGVPGVSKPLLHHVELFNVASYLWKPFGINWPRFGLPVWGVQGLERVLFRLL